MGQLGNLRDNPFQKIPVVGDHNQTAPEFFQPFLQPRHHVGVQMVCRLVENQHIRRVNQRRRQGHPFFLSAGQGAHLLLKIGDAQPGQHGAGFVLGQLPEFGGPGGKHLLHHRMLRLHMGVLGQIGYLNVGVQRHRAAVRLGGPGQNPQQR